MPNISSEPSGSRMLFIDNLRIALTALVMAHHAAVPYMSGHWYYTETVRHSFWSDATLGFFLSVNAAYFMGLFFMISGYFTPPSFDRKGARVFLQDRLLRLGVPFLFYITFLGPFISYFGQVVIFDRRLPFNQFAASGLAGWGIDTGPLWFVEILLIFAGVYTTVRWIFRKQSVQRFAPPKAWALLLVGLAVAGLTFVVRTVFPMDHWVSILKVLHFEPSHFPQYISLFVAGCIAYRGQWFHQLTDASGKAWTYVATSLLLCWPILMIAGGATRGLSHTFYSGWHWQSLAYSIWETWTCIAMIIALSYLFRKYLNRQNQLAKALSASAFTAYVIHPVFIVAVQYGLRQFTIHPVLKFALVSVIGIPLCFFAANLLRQLPGARVVLDQRNAKTI